MPAIMMSQCRRSRARPAPTPGLARFADRYPEAKPLLVGGPGIPLPEFFSRDPAAWLI